VWDSRGRVTLIGDAAHPMAPTASAWATTAVRDAATLAGILESDGVSVEGIERYEKEMREYAGEPIRRSVFGGKMMFGMQGFEDLEPIILGRA
jgi:5-methylphenazine-1-carboxylate 1-monooxygenase